MECIEHLQPWQRSRNRRNAIDVFLLTGTVGIGVDNEDKRRHRNVKRQIFEDEQVKVSSDGQEVYKCGSDDGGGSRAGVIL